MGVDLVGADGAQLEHVRCVAHPAAVARAAARRAGFDPVTAVRARRWRTEHADHQHHEHRGGDRPGDGEDLLRDVAEQVDAEADARAHAIPPSAFQNRNVGHAIWFIPASHAEAIRRPETQRPRKTAFGPWLGEERLAVLEDLQRGACATGPGAANSRRPQRRPIAKPTLSPTIAAAAASTISVTMSIWPSWASSAAAISAVSPGTGMPIVSIAISANTAA